MVDEPRQQHNFADVGHADPEFAHGLLGHERTGCPACLFKPHQRFQQIRVNGLRAWRWFHASRRAAEKRIIKMSAQLVQHHAGAGLLHTEHLRRTRDALRFVDFNENAEPVQVKLCHGGSVLLYIKIIY